MKQVFKLAHDLARQRAMQAVKSAPDGYCITVSEPTRTLEQNAKFHAICHDMNGVAWYGLARNATEWKTLFISGHTVATGGAVEIVAGLEGELVNIRESSAAMSKARASSLIEYSQALASGLGIKMEAA